MPTLSQSARKDGAPAGGRAPSGAKAREQRSAHRHRPRSCPSRLGCSRIDRGDASLRSAGRTKASAPTQRVHFMFAHAKPSVRECCSFAPPGLVSFLDLAPTAYAVGCILTPPRCCIPQRTCLRGCENQRQNLMAFGFGNPTLYTTAKGVAPAECLGRGKKRLRSVGRPSALVTDGLLS